MPFQETEKSIYHYYQILINNAHSSSFYCKVFLNQISIIFVDVRISFKHL